MDKTHVMSFLDEKNIVYTYHCYADSGAVSGIDAAYALKQNPKKVFKTLVTKGESGENYVFLVPVEYKLSNKKAAKFLDEKSVEMIKSTELEPLTGYEHGGCSPLLTKTKLKTLIDSTAQEFDAILINAGKIGYMVEISLEDLKKVLRFKLADIIKL